MVHVVPDGRYYEHDFGVHSDRRWIIIPVSVLYQERLRRLLHSLHTLRLVHGTFGVVCSDIGQIAVNSQ